MMTASPAKLLLLLGFVLAFSHFFYLGAQTFKRTDSDDLPAGIAQFAFLVTGAMAAAFLGFWLPVGLWNGIVAGVLLLGSLLLYEWARRTISDRGFHIALSEDVPDSVCTEGPYVAIRHPIYLSYMLAFVALAIALPGLVSAAILVFNVALFAYAAVSDERSLAKSPLADDYGRYSQSTGMFVPRLRRAQADIRKD